MQEPKRKNGTFIHGIAASEHLDSSGERIQIEGVDISSLTRDGVLNMEHQSKEASAIIGKIWEAKKVLKRSDCENDHQRYFWDKVKMPYIYIAGELFDAVGHKEASEVAAMVRFDSQESLNKDAKRLINFSIEGSRVEKTGAIITKCIARKVSVTLTPCNKVCEAEELKVDPKEEKKQDSGAFSFIQDIMDKAEEPSCQLMKGEIPFLYKNESVKIPAKAAVKEHKRLVAVLESPSNKDDKKEAKKQRKELNEYKQKIAKADKKINPKDPVLNPEKFAPKAPSEAKQKEFVARVTAMQNKKKLNKYDSNVRKALTASCGVGSSPATKTQGAAVAKNEMLYVNDLNKSDYMGVKGNGNKLGETQSGKPVFSHMKVGEYQNFSPQDHMDAVEMHKQAMLKMPSFKDKEHHLNKIRLHQAAFSTSREKQIKQEMGNRPVAPNPMTNMPKAGGTMGYSTQATQYGKIAPKMPVAPMPIAPMAPVIPMKQSPIKAAPIQAKMPAPAGAPAPKPAAPAAPAASENPAAPKMKMAKSEVMLVRKLADADIQKASKNVREQRKKVFGSKSQPGANTPMRDKHMNHIKSFVDQFLGLDLNPSGGKIDEETKQRRKEDNEVGVDKPDWRSGQLESQWNPEAAVHEIAHLMLLPKGIGLEEGQSFMDKQYSNVQKEHGYMQQKRSQGEVQPMAAEQVIRRVMGLPASQVSVPAKSKDAPPRVSVEDPSVVIGKRVQQGADKQGTPKYVDLIRQARNLHPEHKQRLEDIFSKKIIFDPDKGWIPNKGSLDAAITNRQPGAVINRQQKNQEAELPPNVVRMKRPPQPKNPEIADVIAPEPESFTPPEYKQKMAKSEMQELMKQLGNEAFERFEKKEELIAFLTAKLPKLSAKEVKAIAKAVAYTSEKKKEIALKSLVDDE